jgi:hypothetical protein
MITRTLSTLQGKIKIHIPERHSEITLGQMIAMQSASVDIPIIPELTEDVVNNIINIDDLIQIRERVLSLAHQIRYCYAESAIPETIAFGRVKTWRGWKDRKVKVIRNLSIEPAGAYLCSRDLIADEINRHIAEFGEDEWKENFTPSLDCCAGILANYFYCRVTGKLWSEQAAEAFRAEILNLPVSEALPVARYFFMNYNNLYRPKTSLWQAFKQQLKKRQVLKRLRNSNG